MYCLVGWSFLSLYQCIHKYLFVFCPSLSTCLTIYLFINLFISFCLSIFLFSLSPYFFSNFLCRLSCLMLLRNLVSLFDPVLRVGDIWMWDNLPSWFFPILIHHSYHTIFLLATYCWRFCLCCTFFTSISLCLPGNCANRNCEYIQYSRLQHSGGWCRK